MLNNFRNKLKKTYEEIKESWSSPYQVKTGEALVGSFFFGSGITFWAMYIFVKFIGLLQHKHYELVWTEK